MSECDGPACRKPEIDYPCQWLYKVIGQNAVEIRKAIAKALQGKDAEVTQSRDSKRGKYCSLNLALEVTDEAERDRIYTVLRADPAVKMIM